RSQRRATPFFSGLLVVRSFGPRVLRPGCGREGAAPGGGHLPPVPALLQPLPVLRRPLPGARPPGGGRRGREAREARPRAVLRPLLRVQALHPALPLLSAAPLGRRRAASGSARPRRASQERGQDGAARAGPP